MLAGDREVVRAFDGDGKPRGSWRAPAYVNVVATASDGSTWVGHRQGLARIVNGVVEPLSLGCDFAEPVLALLDDGANGVWVGTWSGPRLAQRNAKGELALSARPEGIARDFDVRSFFRDHEGNVWAGSSSRGLARLSPRRLEVFEVGTAGAQNDVTSILEDSAGVLWFVGHNHEVRRLEPNANASVEVPLPRSAPFDADLVALHVDARGRLWGGFKSLAVGRLGDGHFDEIADAPRFASTPIAFANAADGSLWVALEAGELLRIDADDRIVERHDVKTRLSSLAIGADGTVWAGGFGTVVRLSAKGAEREIEVLGDERGVPRGDVRHLLAEADGSVWICTYGCGLARWKQGELRRITRAEGLPDNSLSWIVDDGSGRMWMLANAGLIVAPRAELDAVLEGRAPRVEPVVVGPETGMPEGNGGWPAAWRDARGRLCFATVAGAVRFDPRAFPFNATSPPVRIEYVLGDDRPLELGGVVEVPPSLRRLTIEYTAFALSAPERVRFQTRLVGFDPEPRDIGASRRTGYTALPPGRYVLEVSARNEHGVWSASPARLEIEVLPSLWERTSVQIAAVLAVGLLLLWAHRVRVAKIRDRARDRLELSEARAAAEERASRLRDELAHATRVATAGELAASLAHEVNQPLGAIVINAQTARRAIAGRGDLGELSEVIEDIAQDGRRAVEVVRRLREFLRKQPTDVRPVDLNDVVRATLPLVRRELEDHAVHREIDLEASLPLVQADTVQMQQVIVNLVKNACEALESTSGPRVVRVRTRVDGDQVELEVSDNGPGIAPELAGKLFEPFTSTKPSGMGLGLAICRTIVEAHGGTLNCMSRNEAASGTGACFRVLLPADVGLRMEDAAA